MAIKVVQWRNNDFIKTQKIYTFKRIWSKSKSGFIILSGAHFFWPTFWGISNTDQSRTDSQGVFFKPFHAGIPQGSPQDSPASLHLCSATAMVSKILKSGKGAGEGLCSFPCPCCRHAHVEFPPMLFISLPLSHSLESH